MEGIYAAPEYEQGPPLADTWLWSVGDLWVAVVGEHERPTWWGAGVDDIPPNRPVEWERPIADRPTYGTLRYREATGAEVEVQA